MEDFNFMDDELEMAEMPQTKCTKCKDTGYILEEGAHVNEYCRCPNGTAAYGYDQEERRFLNSLNMGGN
jgi:hypothetical protein